MKTTIFFASILSLFSALASASEWNGFEWEGTTEGEYFFDAETVNKTNDSVNLWIKIIRKNKANDDGSWATANNWKMNCTNRTIQTLSSSTYNADGNFIRSFTTSGSANAVVPDSVGAGILKVVCMADFPKITPATKGLYFKISGNDPFATTKNFSEMKIDKAPQ